MSCIFTCKSSAPSRGGREGHGEPLKEFKPEAVCVQACVRVHMCVHVRVHVVCVTRLGLHVAGQQEGGTQGAPFLIQP